MHFAHCLGIEKEESILDRPNLRRPDRHEQHVPKVLRLDAHAAPRVLRQDVDRAVQTHGVHLKVVARDLPEPLHDARDGRVVPVVVLRGEPEGCDGPVVPRF